MSKSYDYRFKGLLCQAKEIIKAGPWETEKDLMAAFLRLFPSDLPSLSMRDLTRCVDKGNAILIEKGLEPVKMNPKYDPGVCRDLWERVDEPMDEPEEPPGDFEFRSNPPIDWLRDVPPPQTVEFSNSEEILVKDSGWISFGEDIPPNEYYSVTIYADEMNQEIPPDSEWLVDEPEEDE